MAKTSIVALPDKGYGLVADCFIPRDTVILRNMARRIDVSNRSVDWAVGKYLHADPNSKHLDEKEQCSYLVLGHLTLVNHSDDPNSHTKWCLDDDQMPTVELIADTDIREHEEITVRYRDVDAYDSETFV